jgi:hypothetical protein
MPVSSNKEENIKYNEWTNNNNNFKELRKEYENLETTEDKKNYNKIPEEIKKIINIRISKIKYMKKRYEENPELKEKDLEKIRQKYKENEHIRKRKQYIYINKMIEPIQSEKINNLYDVIINNIDITPEKLKEILSNNIKDNFKVKRK